MASWIVHLRVAENLLREINGLDPALFSIGNIAPDSGIPDEKWENFTPSPEVTHFQVSSFDDPDPNAFRSADLDFFRQHLLPLQPDAGKDSGHFSFLLGYFFHLITDNLWIRQIGRPTRARYLEQFNADKDFIWEVKEDWYGLDHIHVRDHPRSLFWQVFMQVEYNRQDLDFLPVNAVQERIRYIKKYYSQPDERVQKMMARPFIYLSQAEMDTFVQDTSRLTLACYHRFWQNREQLNGKISALEAVL